LGHEGQGKISQLVAPTVSSWAGLKIASLYKIMSINTISSDLILKEYQPDILFLEDGVSEYPLVQEILSRLPGVPRQTFQDISLLTEQMKSSQYDVFGEGKKSLALCRFKGSFLKKCPGISPGMVCCN